VDNASVAEHQQRQWQNVGGKILEKSDALLPGSVQVFAIGNAPVFHDIRTDNVDRSHSCRDDDPDKGNCAIHETLFRVQLQNAQEANYHVLTGLTVVLYL